MPSLSLKLLDPVAEYLDEITPDSTIAPRPRTLDGKVVTLLPNWRPSAVHILKAVGTLIEQRYRLKALVMEQPVREIPLRHGKLIDTLGGSLDDLASRADVVIAATGD